MLNHLQRKRGLRRSLRRLGMHQDGVISVEVALMLPLFLSLIYGAAELDLLSLSHAKLDLTSNSLTDIMSIGGGTTTEQQIKDLFSLAQTINGSSTFSANSRIIFTALMGNNNNQNTVLWRRCGGSLGVSTRFSSSPVNLPNNVVLNNGQTAILVEVYYRYVPQTSAVVGSMQLQSTALKRTRDIEFISTIPNPTNVSPATSAC